MYAFLFCDWLVVSMVYSQVILYNSDPAKHKRISRDEQIYGNHGKKKKIRRVNVIHVAWYMTLMLKAEKRAKREKEREGREPYIYVQWQ